MWLADYSYAFTVVDLFFLFLVLWGVVSKRALYYGLSASFSPFGSILSSSLQHIYTFWPPYPIPFNFKTQSSNSSHRACCLFHPFPSSHPIPKSKPYTTQFNIFLKSKTQKKKKKKKKKKESHAPLLPSRRGREGRKKTGTSRKRKQLAPFVHFTATWSRLSVR